MQWLPGERTVYMSPGKTIRVTTHRVRYESHGNSDTIIASIMLEEVASCAMVHRKYPWLLVLAAMNVLGGLVGAASTGAATLAIGGVGVGLILGVAFLLSQELIIAIASAGATISVRAKRMLIEDIWELIDQLEAAKNDRAILVRPAKKSP